MFICSKAIIQTGIQTARIISIIPAVTISVAKVLGIFFDNLSTIGFREQAITNEAKNITAMSLHLKIKTKNKITINEKVIFFELTYFFTKSSNIKYSPKIF
jgi:hypothetical protein